MCNTHWFFYCNGGCTNAPQSCVYMYIACLVRPFDSPSSNAQIVTQVWPLPLPTVYYFQFFIHWSYHWTLCTFTASLYEHPVALSVIIEIEIDLLAQVLKRIWSERWQSHPYLHVFSISLTSAVLFSILCNVNEQDGSAWSRRARGVFNVRNLPLVYLATAT